MLPIGAEKPSLVGACVLDEAMSVMMGCDSP